MRLSAVAVAGLALVAAAAAAPSAEEPVPTRDCRTRTEPTRGLLRFVEQSDVVVGPVAFGRLELARGPRAVTRREDGRLFVKSFVKVLWGPPVTVRLTDATDVLLEYTRPPANAVRFGQCRPGMRMWNGNRYRRVTGFNGGFSFTRRGCYTLEAQAAGRRAYRRTISLGAGACE
jgi:hypothetical protein